MMFDIEEYELLKKEYGMEAEIITANYNFTNNKFFKEFKANISKNRRAEVGFFVQRQNGKFVIVRTSFYPENIYRVPTGGIDYGERVIDALIREVKEELGLGVEIIRFLGAIRHCVNLKEDNLEFYSYMFHLKEISGNILTDATDKEISEFIEVDREGLICTTEFLKNYKGKWHDWCSFRAETTSFIIKYI